MPNRFALDASRRKRLRRMALYAFLGFCVLSAIIHFTVGSLVAMLFPGEKPPAAPPSQVISILTITHLEKEKLPTTFLEQRKIVMRDVTRVEPIKEHEVVQEPTKATSLTISRLTAPAQRSASAGGAGQRVSASQTAGAGSHSGATMAATRTAAGSGASASADGEDESYPGRQMPGGAVFSANGPPGQNGATSGNSIQLGGRGVGIGDGGDAPLKPIPDNCSPSREQFF
jgi:hypothetical protein